MRRIYRLGLNVSLRTKVLIAFLGAVVLVLLLSNVLYFFSAKNVLIQSVNVQNRDLSNAISAQVGQSQQGLNIVDGLLAVQLRTAAVAAEASLNPDVTKVTNEQLKVLAAKLGVSDITLFKKTKNDIVGVKSSDPREIGLSTKGMSGWYTAFYQLMTQNNAHVNFGTSLKNFWTGPFANATSAPNTVDKWGYYYDGKTNYLIDPFIHASSIPDFSMATSPEAIIKAITQENHGILEVAAFNPNAFGKEPIKFQYSKESWVDLKNYPVLFGSYTYRDESRDVAAVHEAMSTKQTVSFTDVVKGKTVLKTFVPILKTHSPYVLGFVRDYSPITQVLTEQIHDSLWISSLLLIVVIIVSFLLSGYIVKPLLRITKQVEQISDIKFTQPLSLKRNDEIGALAKQVNVMSRNLSDYTRELTQSVRKERSLAVSYLGMITSGLIHELRNPLTVVKNMIDFLPRMQPLEPQTQQFVELIQQESGHLNSIIMEFGDFIRNGKLNQEEHNLVSLVTDIVKYAEPHAAASNITIDFHAPLREQSYLVYVDAEKIKQVMINVVRNGMDAIDEDAAERCVSLTLSHTPQELILDITDSGHGISKDRWEAIFAPFQTSKPNGFGLGLSLSKFIVLANGGKIFVKQSNPEGTVIRIAFPRAELVCDET